MRLNAVFLLHFTFNWEKIGEWYIIRYIIMWQYRQYTMFYDNVARIGENMINT